MKKLFFLSLMSFAIFFANAQLITTDPAFPVADQSVTIYFDATLGNGALAGYTGDVYAHTGVITENSTSGSDWRYVIADWDENIPEALLTQISADYYSLEISPSIIDFYGVPDGEEILQMAFVFRSEDGSIVGKDEGEQDIYITIPNPTEIYFSSPDTTKIYSPNEEIQISAAALFATEMTLFVNDSEIQSVSTDNIDVPYTLSTSGMVEIKIEATDGTQTMKDSINIYVRQPNNIAELPSNDLQDGINYIDDNTVTLVLYAPYKDFVFVKGSFDNWELGDDNQMNQTPDGTRYWLTLENLTAGEEYAYQYIIDGELYVADAYTDKILDPWNDQYISSSTYWGLDYPDEYADGILSTFKTAQNPYSWQVPDFQAPAPEDLIIYELHIRDFIEAHDYNTLIDTIPYLKNLGINAIELMPINEFEGNSSWGYNPSFYFAPDKYYGSKYSLKNFIDECHLNGIAVIIDMVLNHSYGQNPMVQMYFDPTAGDWGQPTAENPWFNETSPNPVYSWGSDFDHESEDTKRFMTRVNRYWLEDYNVDGFRFDFTKGFTNNGGDGWAYDADRIQILKDMADSIWFAEPDAYVILEHFADNSEETILANYGMMLWGNLNHAYCQSAMGYNSESDFSWISYQNRGWDNPHVVGYMESHDEERVMFKNLTYGNDNGNYNIQNLQTALSRGRLVSLFFLTIPGPKMIWQFGELGYDISIDEPCRVCEKPILWEYFEEENRQNLYHFYSELLELRKTHDIFRTENFSISANSSVKQIVLEGSTMDMVIVGNFGVTEKTASPNFTNTGTWYEYYTGETITGDQDITLAPGRYRLYTTENIGTTSVNITEFSDDDKIVIKPNPFSEKIVVSEISDYQKITVMDLQGRKIKSFETQKTSNLELDLSELKAGTYFIMLSNSETKVVKKIVKM